MFEKIRFIVTRLNYEKIILICSIVKRSFLIMESVRKSQLNNSISKVQHLFSKFPRFLENNDLNNGYITFKSAKLIIIMIYQRILESDQHLLVMDKRFLLVKGSFGWNLEYKNLLPQINTKKNLCLNITKDNHLASEEKTLKMFQFSQKITHLDQLHIIVN